MSKNNMKRVFRCDRTGSTIRLDGISKSYHGASCDNSINKSYHGMSCDKRLTSASQKATEADAARNRMITRQTRKPADSVPERMTGAEYAREKMLERMLTPPAERK